MLILFFLNPQTKHLTAATRITRDATHSQGEERPENIVSFVVVGLSLVYTSLE